MLNKYEAKIAALGAIADIVGLDYFKAPEKAAYASGDSLEDYIRGKR